MPKTSAEKKANWRAKQDGKPLQVENVPKELHDALRDLIRGIVKLWRG